MSFSHMHIGSRQKPWENLITSSNICGHVCDSVRKSTTTKRYQFYYINDLIQLIRANPSERVLTNETNDFRDNDFFSENQYMIYFREIMRSFGRHLDYHNKYFFLDHNPQRFHGFFGVHNGIGAEFQKVQDLEIFDQRIFGVEYHSLLDNKVAILERFSAYKA